MSNQWTFTGRLTDLSTRKAGSYEVTQVVIENNTNPSILCVCEAWFTVPLTIGTKVYAAGAIKGRPWEDKGKTKYFAGLTCEELHAVAVAGQEDAPPQPTAAEPGQTQPGPIKPAMQDLPF